MISAWRNSWGDSWGDSWGAVPVVTALSGTGTLSISGTGALSAIEAIVVDFGGRLRPREIDRIRRIKEDDDEIAVLVAAALITLRMQNYDRPS